ncbi:DNA/RNA nuclease SfsA [Spongorhabdus nitratireducens]
MKFEPPLQSGRLIRRYKRFLADIETDDGQQFTIHCPNTGSMKNCGEPGSRIWFSDSGNPKRKYRHTWELVETRKGITACVNTGQANKLVEEAITAGTIPALRGYGQLRREVKYGDSSRIDLLLSDDNKTDCYIEVKSVTLEEAEGHGFFPDAVSTRGQKHLLELLKMKQAGCRAVLLFCVQHTGISQVSPADHIDPAYGKLLREVFSAGVEVIAWQSELSAQGMELSRELPVKLQP